ncbi:MAG: hypothetical protein M1827_004377 [Pycnora praestabilis]|nr:MAG: hypothetical protein M1827_004377 [Pycnora praestabilis]
MAPAVVRLAQAPDPTRINLTRLLSRLQHTLISPDGDSRALRSSYERTRIGANLDYARSLLLRLEHESSSIKTQSRKQNIQADLVEKRELLRRLNEKLHELGQLNDDETSEGEDGEDLLHEDLGSEDQIEIENHAFQIAGDDSANADSPLDRRRLLTAESPQMSSSLRARRRLSSPQDNTGTTSGTSTSKTAQTETLLTHHRTEQESLTTDLLSMAQALKASSLQFSELLGSEKEVLDRAGEGLEKNTTGMEAAEKRMGTLRRMSEGKGWWGRMLLYAWLAGLMFVAFFIVAFLPKLRF